MIAAVYGAAAAALFPRTRDRDVSALLAAAALALVAFGAADLLSGPALAIAWAAEAAVLSWLARRIQEFRYQLASLAYLAAALVQALALDAPPRQLYEASQHPASGALALVGVALAGGIVAYYCRPWKAARQSAGILAPLEPSFALFRNSQPIWRSLTGWTAAAVALYAASLGVLGLAQWLSSAGIERAFEWGQVAVAGLWGAVALAVLYAGLRRSWNEFRAAGFVVLCAALAQALLFFSTSLSGSPQALGFLVVAAALLAGSLLDRLWRADPTAFPAIIVYALSSLGLAVAAFVLLASGAIEGLALLALAGFYCLISALVFRRDRDLATLLWAPALGVACVGFGEALSGTWLVLAWAATAVALAAIADLTAERRLQIASLAYLALAAGHALVLDSPPSHFFEATRHPATGVPAVLIVVLAAAAVAYLLRAAKPRERGDRLDRAIEERQERWRHVSDRRRDDPLPLRRLPLDPRSRRRDREREHRGQVPRRTCRGQRGLGPARPGRPLRRAPQGPRLAAGSRLRTLRGQPGEDLPLRPHVPELDHAGALVPRGRRRAATRRVLRAAAGNAAARPARGLT